MFERIQLKSPAMIMLACTVGSMYVRSLLWNLSLSFFFSVLERAYMLTIHFLLNIAAIPLPDGIRFIFVMVMPSFASMTVPLLSAPSFIYAVFRRIALKSGVVTSCTSARSMSFLQRNSSSILRCVLDAVPFMFNVATLHIYMGYCGRRNGCKFIVSAVLCCAFYCAFAHGTKSYLSPSLLSCCFLD